jgi:hypothetical protein
MINRSFPTGSNGAARLRHARPHPAYAGPFGPRVFAVRPGWRGARRVSAAGRRLRPVAASGSSRLSACESGRGREEGGEGLVGISRGFLYAGAARLVTTLWDVDDASTADLMARFYGAMLGPQALPPTAALRAAQRGMIEGGRWSAPYRWAAFTVQGEWR